MLNEAGLKAAAIVEAEWDGRTFEALGRGDKERYLRRLEATIATYLTSVQGDPKTIYEAVLSCPHSIVHDMITLRFDPKQNGHNALAQLAARLTAYVASVQGDPVAWQWRSRTRDNVDAPWSEWGSWHDGKVNVLYMTGIYSEYEERPLFTPLQHGKRSK